MIPKEGITYEIKAIHYEGLPAHSKILKHIHLCGNEFKYRTASGSCVNMECKRCGWRFLTMTDTFGERYNIVGSALKVIDPNFLFSKYKRGEK